MTTKKVNSTTRHHLERLGFGRMAWSQWYHRMDKHVSSSKVEVPVTEKTPSTYHAMSL